jgi:hypothetical protein
VLRACADSFDELAAFVAQLGVPLEVHEPPELITHCARSARLLRAAGGPVSVTSG